MKNISILGSTGSIGTQALEVVRSNKGKFKVVGLTAGKNIDLLEKQIREFNPKVVALMDEEKSMELKKRISHMDVEILSGIEGLNRVATLKSTQIVLTSVVGMVGLVPTMKAIEAKKDIALANKETLVTAGKIVMDAAKKNKVKILPVDSEHSAIFQSLSGYENKDINRVILTASGGPFRGLKRDEVKDKKVNEALKHPKWNMGKKISIDSATLMNKGLEVIEAKWLFDVEPEQIEVVVHPQSIIHSMVEYKDSSIISQMGYPDMRVPIQYALTYPKRTKNNYERTDFYKIGQLTFEKADTETFPCLELAYEALKKGGSYPAVLNGANEELVELYIQEKIKFYDISDTIKEVLEAHVPKYNFNVKDIIQIDKWSRDFVKNKFKGV
ncbi:MAG: 1-deoxy-D-xylulose-5-phosphate reductoisomerase [Anaeromicrobium sp.]|jgi:1-deoxy-D-xylulose-5-phosphate reductoisomerase|uniref:1-deoxy-D-xylulose-5-phosphate reductoisomerase n=1 Tax=Anaeromicrobium sp. TaxID=1929132 RepID=UPI0025CEB60C|nr:1-deoxy-D-xylulose-5-phosphate reductoisomerase [Anaeromicrobium sp.]MCT4595620.1 1-deoxy-D-xylulose-5-phosphate reductoisomerase [Anaeromicrobium sp.]